MPYWAREEPLIRKGRPDKKFAELMVGPGLGRLFLDRRYCSVQQITGHVVGQPILAAAAFQAALSLLTPVHPFPGHYPRLAWIFAANSQLTILRRQSGVTAIEIGYAGVALATREWVWASG